MTTTAPERLEEFRLFIDGRSVDALSGRTFESQNPYLGRPWARVADGGPEDVDVAVGAARAAFDGEWGQLTGFQRAAVMRACAEGIAANAERLARLEVQDSGKLLREMLGQMTALPQWFFYFSGLADKLEGRTIPPVNPNYFGYTRREPVGVVAAITPWNSPLLLLTWKLAPLLAAGNTCVVKPSEHSPASTVAFAEVLFEAGLPAGVLNVVTGWDRATGEALAGHPGVDKVAFTGSTATGVRVAQAAAANVNRVTLELGGKSPQIVFPDADLDAAANGLIAGVFAATGQTCMAGSRLIVHADVHEALVAKVAERARSIRLGDPTAADTEMGPVANQPQYEKVLGYLRGAQEEGATFA
ncbi:MAG: aldehyde dehydrogenase family protein, partial [Blastococcus sp.]